MKKILLILILVNPFIEKKAIAQSGIMAPNYFSVPKVSNLPACTVPDKGKTVYNSADNKMYFCDGSTWQAMMGAVSAGIGWAQNGNNIYKSNSGNVGIGTSKPKNTLTVNGGYGSGLRLLNLVGSPDNIYSPSYPLSLSSIDPRGVAFDNENNLYITTGSNKIIKYSADNVKSDFVVSGLNSPWDIIFGPDGNFYVSNMGTNSVLKVTTTGVVSTFATGFSIPQGLTFDNSGNLYVVNNGSNTISKINSSGTVLSHSWATGLNGAYGCDYNPKLDAILIANHGANNIAKVGLAGGLIAIHTPNKRSFAITVLKESGITFFSDLNASNQYLYKMDGIGTPEIFISTANNQSLTSHFFDLCFDEKGILAVSHYVDNIVYFIQSQGESALSVNFMGDVVHSSNINITSAKIDAYYATSLAPLHVGGQFNIVTTGQGHFFYPDAGLSTKPNYSANLSIYATNGIVSNTYVGAAVNVISSDSRIKKDISLSNNSADLERLLKIQITNYRMKDAASWGNQTFKKVIAQQVEEVYPEVINRQTQVIPDIYALAESVTYDAAKKELKCSLPNDYKIQVGDKLELVHPEKGKIQTEVIEVSGKSFTVKNWEFATDKIFVFGREVNDFRTVDYDALSMLGISAIQALAKENEELQSKISDLRLKSEKSIARLEKLENLLNQKSTLEASNNK